MAESRGPNAVSGTRWKSATLSGECVVLTLLGSHSRLQQAALPTHLSCSSWQTTGPEHRIDACFLENPAQAELPPEDRRWVLFFGGNGELFEFALPDMHRFAASTGLSCFAFNYRGVSLSSGFPTSAADLAQDGGLCMQYLHEILGCPPAHVLLFGHRCVVWPTAPLALWVRFVSLTRLQPS